MRVILLFLIFVGYQVQAQDGIIPLNYQNYLTLDSLLDNPTTITHSSIKPLLYNDLGGKRVYDSLQRSQLKDTTAFKHKLVNYLLNKHQIEARGKDYGIAVDFIPDWRLGYDASAERSTYLNSRGIFLSGHIGKTVSFNSEFIANLAEFPDYVVRNINSLSIIPGVGKIRFLGSGPGYDFGYSTGSILYRPSKFFSFQFGHGKNFIGDGYRSMLLSNQAFNYPFLKVLTEFWRIKYMNLFAQFQDLKAPKFNPKAGDQVHRKKWGAFHYLDFVISKRITVGFFEAIIWNDQDSLQKRGFDINYLNPIIYLRPVEFSVGSPDNALLGGTFKVELPFRVVLYGQGILDEFKTDEFISDKGWWGNKYGIQLGLKKYVTLENMRMKFLGEFNTATPYTYSHNTSITNYGHYNESLAHPMMANFREYVGILQFHYFRWRAMLQLNTATYGLNDNGKNFGKDIFQSYNTRVSEYGNFTGQGVRTNLNYYYASIGYLVNPANSLLVEVSVAHRAERNNINTFNDTWFNFTIRGGIRDLFLDF